MNLINSSGFSLLSLCRRLPSQVRRIAVYNLLPGLSVLRIVGIQRNCEYLAVARCSRILGWRRKPLRQPHEIVAVQRFSFQRIVCINRVLGSNSFSAYSLFANCAHLYTLLPEPRIRISRRPRKFHPGYGSRRTTISSCSTLSQRDICRGKAL